MRRASSYFAVCRLLLIQSPRHLILAALVLVTSDWAYAKEVVRLGAKMTEHPAVDEILVRAHAELVAIGFSVIRCDEGKESDVCLEGHATGRLQVDESNGRLLLRAWSQGEAQPLSQQLDLTKAGVSPEVAAIRAVELLRAALLLALREGKLETAPGAVVRGFTGWREEARDPRTPSPASDDVQTSAPPTVLSPWRWAMGLGPSVTSPGLGLTPKVGAEFFLDATHRFLYLGGAIDAMLFPSAIERPEGRTSVTSLMAVARAGWAAPCGDHFACRLGAAVGVAQYDFQTDASDPYIGTDERHFSFYSGVDLTLCYYFRRGVGGFFRLRGGALAQAARLDFDEQVLLGRPVSGLSLGVTFR